jgi:hypothetical protein
MVWHSKELQEFIAQEVHPLDEAKCAASSPIYRPYLKLERDFLENLSAEPSGRSVRRRLHLLLLRIA